MNTESALLHRNTIANGLTAMLLATAAMDRLATDDSYSAGYIAGRLDVINEVATFAGVTLELPAMEIRSQDRM